MGVFARKSGRLYFRLKGLDGKWKNEPTPYRAGQEADAERYAVAAQRAIDRKRGALPAGAMPTVAEYAVKWLEERKTLGLRSVADDIGRINNHVLPVFGAVLMDAIKPRNVRDFVRDLRRTDLAPRTIINVYGIMSTMFRDAVVEEVIPVNPCMLKRGDLPAKVDKDPNWRAEATYTNEEVRTLVCSEKLPPDRRVQYALKALAGMRHGEIAGLRWRNYDPSIEPLGRLVVAYSYDARTKTEVTRLVPVHPTLARILEAWRRLYVTVYGREPSPDDLIVPARSGRMVRARNAGKAMRKDLVALGLRVDAGAIRKRGGHDLRAWFLSTAQEHGALREVIAEITHTKKRDVISGYSRHAWHVLCGELAKIPFDVPDADILPVCFSFASRSATLSKRWRKVATPTGFEPVASGPNVPEEGEKMDTELAALPRKDLDRLREEARLLRELAAAVLEGDEVNARRLAVAVGPAQAGRAKLGTKRRVP